MRKFSPKRGENFKTCKSGSYLKTNCPILMRLGMWDPCVLYFLLHGLKTPWRNFPREWGNGSFQIILRISNFDETWYVRPLGTLIVLFGGGGLDPLNWEIFPAHIPITMYHFGHWEIRPVSNASKLDPTCYHSGPTPVKVVMYKIAAEYLMILLSRFIFWLRHDLLWKIPKVGNFYFDVLIFYLSSR